MGALKLAVTFFVALIVGLLLNSDLITSSSFLCTLFRILMFYSLSFFLIYWIHRKVRYYLPSAYILFLFFVIPIIAIPGTQMFMKILHEYRGTHINVLNAMDIWAQGAFYIMLGIFTVHIVRDFLSKNDTKRLSLAGYPSWDWSKFRYLLILLAGISLIFSTISILRLGYIPILKTGIERERFTYIYTAGEWSFKLARLWLLVYLLALTKLLYNIQSSKKNWARKNFVLIFILLVSFMFDAIYGDRFHLFIMLFFTIIMINKHIGKIKMRYFLMLFIIGLALSSTIFIIRGADALIGKASIFERVMIPMFSEWREFAYIAEHYPSVHFLNGKTFSSVIAPIFPNIVWGAIGFNKYELLSESSAIYMQKLFGSYAGVRIGIIGEGFINFGYIGVIWVSFITGLIFGTLESIFLRIQSFHVCELILAFILGTLIFLPIAQTDAISVILIFYSYFISLCILFFHKKEVISNPKRCFNNENISCK